MLKTQKRGRGLVGKNKIRPKHPPDWGSWWIEPEPELMGLERDFDRLASEKIQYSQEGFVSDLRQRNVFELWERL